MTYPLITMDDNLEIVHSEMRADGKVKVYVEKPDEKDCLHHATCWVPGYQWEDIYGFSQKEVDNYQAVIESFSRLILRFAKEGSLENAASF